MRYINLLLTLSIDIDVSACRSIREGDDDVSRPEDQQEENVDQAQYVESGIQRGNDVRRTSTHRRGSLSRRQRIPPRQVRVVHGFG